MAAACGVELVEIKELGSCARERELEHIGKLALAPGQDIYVGDAVEMTVRGLGIAGRHPFSIVAGQETVGVGTLHVGAATDAGWPDDDGAILLRGFLIGRSHLNTLPGSDTNRYLAGQGAGANGAYTFWTEAFAVVGNPEEAPTVAPSELHHAPNSAVKPPPFTAQSHTVPRKLQGCHRRRRSARRYVSYPYGCKTLGENAEL